MKRPVAFATGPRITVRLAMASDCPTHTAAEATMHAVANDAHAAELGLLHQRLASHRSTDRRTARRRGQAVRGAREPNGRGRKHSNHNRTHQFSLSFPSSLAIRIVHVMRREPSMAAGGSASVTTRASADAPHDDIQRIYQTGTPALTLLPYPVLHEQAAALSFIACSSAFRAVPMTHGQATDSPAGWRR